MEKQEQEELNILTGKGYEFETILFGEIKKWNTGKMTLGKMLKLSQVFIKMKVDESALSNEDLSIQIPAQYESVRDNAELCALAMAISLGDVYRKVIPAKYPKWLPSFITKKIKKVDEVVPVEAIKQHFLDSIDSKELAKFTIELLKNADYQSFITSTVLMNGNRPTKAIPIEKTV